MRGLASPGVVAVEGSAVPAGDTLAAPVTGREAVVAAWLVEEWDERADESHWRPVARGVETSGFAVDDGTAAVAVGPVSKRDTATEWTQTSGVSAADGVRVDDVLAEFGSFPTRVELDPDEEPPDAIAALHADHDLYEASDSVLAGVPERRTHGRRRYSEQVVEPGDDVYVRGRVEGRDDPERRRFRPGDAVVTEPEDGRLVLSDQDASSLEAEFASAARLRLLAGVGALVVGALAFAVLLGLV